MRINYLFPHKFKSIGWVMLIPSAILGILTVIYEYEPKFLDFNVPALFVENFNSMQLFAMINNNLLNEILGVLVIISALFVALSKEKSEDEYISKIRLESLVWAVYFNYAVLLFSLLFIYNFSFFYVMIFNMFTVLIFFIIRFNLQISKLQKSFQHEE